MANAINTSNLTLNAKESVDFSAFIIEKIFTRPELKSIMDVVTGVKMKEQIVLAGQFGKTGIKGTSTCTRKESGAQSVMSQKYWEPVGIEDTLILCQASLDALFKAYYDKITSYKQKYDIVNSDEEVFLSLLIEESINATIPRAAWFGDKNIAVATSGTSGLIASGDTVFYNYFDGIFAQIFDGVTAGDIEKVAITQNAGTTIVAQTTLANNVAENYFEAMWAKADPRLKSDPTRQILVSGTIFENYRKSLSAKGDNQQVQYIQEGFSSLKWNGMPVINMETVWDVTLKSDFKDNTVNNAYYLPNRIVLSTPSNIKVATLNEQDFTELEVWYEKKEREYNIAYGFSLDSKVIEEYMIVVAY